MGKMGRIASGWRNTLGALLLRKVREPCSKRGSTQQKGGGKSIVHRAPGLSAPLFVNIVFRTRGGRIGMYVTDILTHTFIIVPAIEYAPLVPSRGRGVFECAMASVSWLVSSGHSEIKIVIWPA